MWRMVYLHGVVESENLEKYGWKLRDVTSKKKARRLYGWLYGPWGA